MNIYTLNITTICKIKYQSLNKLDFVNFHTFFIHIILRYRHSNKTLEDLTQEGLNFIIIFTVSMLFIDFV